MTEQARGDFEVKIDSLQPYNTDADAKLGRMSIEKDFRGDLEATSKGEMLSAGSVVEGSAGYVAIERVTGTLHGRSGSFVLQHNATMTRGEPYMSVIVAPDSGTGRLTGITGKMTILIAGGRHSYEFAYSLPDVN